MNNISVLGTVISLYRASDGVRSALHDLIELFENIDRKAKLGKQQQAESKHKAREKWTSHRPGDFVDEGPNVEPERVFKNLIDAFNQFHFACRDFHDYADKEGEENLKKFIKTATVSNLDMNRCVEN